MIRRCLFAAFAVAALAATPAKAINPACEVLPTPNGFAALRAGPSVDARLVARMKTGHNVQLRADDQGKVISSGPWMQVLYWPEGRLYEPTQPEYSTAKIGWVAQRLIGDCG